MSSSRGTRGFCDDEEDDLFGDLVLDADEIRNQQQAAHNNARGNQNTNNNQHQNQNQHKHKQEQQQQATLLTMYNIEPIAPAAHGCLLSSPPKNLDQDKVRSAVKVYNETNKQMHHALSPDTAATWIYPSNVSLRKYQLEISRTALMKNTLVVLPTGLGKTMIAAVVIFNFMRWYPTGKVLFCAPTKPLVGQQIDACQKITGISKDRMACLDASIQGSKRSLIWETKSVFFATPQTIISEINRNRCNPKDFVCCIFDEAHKATGKYAYVKIVDNIFPVGGDGRCRIVGLSATPGNSTRKIGDVVRNLRISDVEVRSDDDPDVKKYLQSKTLEIVEIPRPPETDELLDGLNRLGQRTISSLARDRILPALKLSQLNQFTLNRAKMKLFGDAGLARDRRNMIQGQIGHLMSLLPLAKMLECYDVTALKTKMEESFINNPARSSMISRSEFIDFHRTVTNYANLASESLSPKMEKLREIVADHFAKCATAGTSTRVIIFSNLKQTVHVISSALGVGLPFVRGVHVTVLAGFFSVSSRWAVRR